MGHFCEMFIRMKIGAIQCKNLKKVEHFQKWAPSRFIPANNQDILLNIDKYDLHKNGVLEQHVIVLQSAN